MSYKLVEMQTVSTRAYMLKSDRLFLIVCVDIDLLVASSNCFRRSITLELDFYDD